MSQEHSRRRYRRIGWGAVSGLFARAAASVLGLWSVPLLVGYAGRSDYGLLMAAQTVVTWLVLFDLGIAGSLVNLVSDAYGRDDRGRIRALVRSGFAMHLGIGLAGAALCLLAPRLPWAAWFPQADERQALVLGRIVMGCGVVFFLALPLQLMHSILRALQWSHASNLVQAASSLISLALLWSGIRMGVSLPVLAVLLALANVLPILPVWAVVWRRLSLGDREGAAAGTWRDILRISAPLFLFQVGGLLVNETAMLVVSRRCGFDLAGDYGLAMRVYGMLFLLGASIGMPFSPAVREAHARGHHAWVWRAALRILAVRLALVVLPALPLLVWGDDLLAAWSGQPLARPLGVMGWGWLIAFLASASFSSTVSELMMSLDRIWSQLPVLAGNALVLFCCLNLALPGLGVAGALASGFMGNLFPLCWAVHRLFRDPAFLRARHAARS